MEVYICMGCESRFAASGRPKRCKGCGKGSGFIRPFSEASYVLAGMEGTDKERAVVREIVEGERLSATLRSAGRDVSAKSGEMERNSPLFYGMGDNPTLF
jgi:hypothetical protein